MITRTQLEDIFSRARELGKEYSGHRHVTLMNKCEDLFPNLVDGINLETILTSVAKFNNDVTDEEFFQIIKICNIKFEEV